MGKNHQLAVLSLFLLVPASIICAQTVNLTGTVTMEQDYRAIQFNSPNGNVNVILPGDLSGPGQGTVSISGTVRTEPAGKNEKERASNLKALEKMILKIGANSIPVQTGQKSFTLSMPPNLMTPVSINLEDPMGARATVELKKPLVSPPPTTSTLPAGQPAIYTDQKIFITNSNIPVYAANNTATLFQASDQFYIKDAAGSMKRAAILAQSPTQTVLDGQGLQPGATTIVRQTTGRRDEVQVRMASLSLTSPNTNLRRGQTSSLMVTVDPKLTEKDSAEAMQIPIMSLDVKNLTPTVIDMAGGNYQVMTFPGGSNPGNANAWQISRTITGVTPGSFNVSATLFPSTENTNPVHAQLEEIKTAEEFNKWSNATKKDLGAYLKDLPAGDVTRRELVQHVTSQLPAAVPGEDPELAKMEARYLLRQLPAFRNYLSGEGLAAFQTYFTSADRLKNAGPKNGWPLHTDIIERGLNFIQHQNTNPVNPTVQQLVSTALEATNAVQQDYSAKNITALTTALQTLNSTPFVTGLADVPAVLYPHIVKTDGPIGARMNGHDVTPDEQVIRFYDDGAVIIFVNKIRYIFKAVAAEGTSVKALMKQYDDPAYPKPALVDCDSLKRICKKTVALTIFWGNIYSVTKEKSEELVLNGVAKDKKSQSSLLITRGWEMDCCTGEFKLQLFFQTMGPGQSFSFTKTLATAWSDPCPPADDCPECIKKCEEDKKTKEGH